MAQALEDSVAQTLMAQLGFTPENFFACIFITGLCRPRKKSFTFSIRIFNSCCGGGLMCSLGEEFFQDLLLFCLNSYESSLERVLF